MKFWLCLFVFVLVCNMDLRAQKHDYVWLSGYYSNIGYDSIRQIQFGTSIMDFNLNPRSIRYDSLKMNFDRTNASYCDSNGNLLFYTNGIYIANKIDEKIENSDSLNAGALQFWWDTSINNTGYRTPQGVIIIPSALSQSHYFIFHILQDTIATYSVFNPALLLTQLDLSANAGLGKVTSKNQVLLEDTLGFEITATKHANGRDWWMLVQKRNTNCYHRIFISESGPMVLSDMICGAAITTSLAIGSVCFSTDGAKFAQVSGYSGINIYDFDRCSGTFSSATCIPIPVLRDSGWIGMGVAFSPNNRFLYVGVSEYVFQYDLWATDVSSSVDTVAVYDGYQSPFGSYFFTMQLGPDGKIYESCGNGENVYHVIERPDEKGDSCLFRQHAIHLPTFSLGVPNFPNYRLGALPGSPCDTLTGLNEVGRSEKEKLLKIFPNPATNFVTIDYGFTDWNKGEVSLEITNELGQLVHQQPVPMYSGFQKIEVQNFVPGMYTAFIKRKGQVVATAKFAKQ